MAYDRKDHYYDKAKAEGYRSRAAYKLKELNKKHKLLRPGFRVLDLGAWPGGWLQVAREEVGPNGVVVGIDLARIEGFPEKNVHCFEGDVRDEAILAQALSVAKGSFQVILSDMAPKLSGIREVDHVGSVACAELALHIAMRVLEEEGSFVTKVFKSNEAEVFVKTTRPMFNKVLRIELDATRKGSSEYYVVGLGFKGASAIR